MGSKPDTNKFAIEYDCNQRRIYLWNVGGMNKHLVIECYDENDFLTCLPLDENNTIEQFKVITKRETAETICCNLNDFNFIYKNKI